LFVAVARRLRSIALCIVLNSAPDVGTYFAVDKAWFRGAPPHQHNAPRSVAISADGMLLSSDEHYDVVGETLYDAPSLSTTNAVC
jgi:hypothetical protein